MKRACRPRPPLSRPVAAPAQLGSPRPRRPARGGRSAPLARSLARSAFMSLSTQGFARADMQPPTPPARSPLRSALRSVARSLAAACVYVALYAGVRPCGYATPYAPRSLAAPFAPTPARLPPSAPSLRSGFAPLARRAFMSLPTQGFARAFMQPTGSSLAPLRARADSARLARWQRACLSPTPLPALGSLNLTAHPPRAGAAPVPCLRALRGFPRAPPRAEKRRPSSPLHCRRTPPTPPSQHQTGRKSRHTDEKPNPAARAARRDSKEARKQEGQEGELSAIAGRRADETARKQESRKGRKAS